MPNTYTKIYIHLVFAVKGRCNLISESIREKIEKYISGIISGKKQKLYAIYCMPDHIHILLSMKPDIALSELVKIIKQETTNFINENKLIKSRFNWQHGFGAFSYAESQVDNVVKYILNQPQHHYSKNFREEYIDFLKKFNIEYNNKFLFEWIE